MSTEKETIEWCVTTLSPLMGIDFSQQQQFTWMAEAVNNANPVEFHFKDATDIIGIARFKLFLLKVEAYVTEKKLMSTHAISYSVIAESRKKFKDAILNDTERLNKMR